MRLDEFLAQKPLYYSEIDYTRMPRAYASIKDNITVPKVIHVVGTNGKGTTGRFIANALVALGLNTGHYTSPHIFEFNERIWINGQNTDDETLEKAHKRLLKILPLEFQKSLSYFEYTTFLAMIVYEKCDYVVLEAGLGGEHDATNVFKKIISVITPIGLDHEEFLGNSIEEVAATKLRSVRSKAIIAEQKFDEVFKTAKGLEKDFGVQFISYKDIIDQDMTTIAEEVSQEFQMPHYLKENLLLSMAVITELGFKVSKKLFEYQPLQGRMQRIKHNVWLDLGHNALAAEAISHCFCKKSVNLVYNSYKDKDFQSILRLLEPIVKKVEIIQVEGDRVASKDDLVSAITDNGLEYKDFEGIKEDESYLVFGSFSVAGAFARFC